MLRYLAQNMTDLIQSQKNQADNQSESSKHKWPDADKYRNLKAFDGSSKDWEELSAKLRSQVAAGNAKVLAVMEDAEVAQGGRHLAVLWPIELLMLLEQQLERLARNGVNTPRHNMLLSHELQSPSQHAWSLEALRNCIERLRALLWIFSKTLRYQSM